MNNTQKVIGVIVCIVFMVMLLYPPFVFITGPHGPHGIVYGFLLNNPEHRSINTFLLLVQMFGVLMIGAIACLITNRAGGSNHLTGGLWEHKGENGQTFFCGPLSPFSKIYIVPNTHKDAKSDPDFFFYLGASEKKAMVKPEIEEKSVNEIDPKHTAHRSIIKPAVFLCATIMLVNCFAVLAYASVTSAHPRTYSKTKVVRHPRNLVLYSSSALVEDQRTGKCLVQKQADAILPIASITKLMTAMVVLDAKMNLNESITISSEDVDTIRHSRSRLPVDASLTRRNALLLALMASENRAAHALGRTYPGGLAAFVAAMNTKARSLGLTETRFEDPTGISNGNTSSARDLARLVNAAYHYNLIRKFTTSDKTTIDLGHRTLQYRNTNVLLRNPRWQIGLSKTGFIDEAGRCLVMQLKVGKRPMLIVLLDAPGKSARYADAKRIKQWVEGSQLTRKKYRG